MDTETQIMAVIRQRGQLTIPDQIRKVLVWLRENSVVSLSIIGEELRIKPFSQVTQSEEGRWKKAWEMIQLARSFKGRKGSLSKFVAEDRLRH